MWTVLPCSQLWGWFTHPFSDRVGCIGLPKRGASSCCWPEFHHSTGKYTRTTCICSYGVQRTTLGIILQNVTHLAWDRALIGLELTKMSRQAGGESPEILLPISAFPVQGLQVYAARPGLLCGFGGLNSGLHSCKASTLWTESFSQPQSIGLSNIPSGLLASDTLKKSKLNFNWASHDISATIS